MAKAANVILVQGAWADGSCWSKVIPLLQSHALRVSAVQLPLTSFDSDVATYQRPLPVVVLSSEELAKRLQGKVDSSLLSTAC